MRTGHPRPRPIATDILAVMGADPTVSATIGALAAQLGRSHGAITYAMNLLADRGHVYRATAGGGPRAYRLTDAGIRAAASASTPPPAGGRAAACPPSPTSPTSSPATSTPVPVRGPIRRPNGQLYHPRTLGDTTDVEALRRLRAADIPVLLAGPPGAGKTSLVEAAFADAITVAGDGDTTVADLVGDYTQRADGRYEFIHGPLPVAMREGRALFLDDATLIPPAVQAVLYPAMDGRRTITIKAHAGDTVTAAPGFYVIAGHNPGVHGAILAGPLASRFGVHIEVNTDYELAEALGIDPRAVRAARNLATQAAADTVGWAPQMRELTTFSRLAATLGEKAAIANLLAAAPPADRDQVAAALRDAFGTSITPLRLGHRHCGR